MVVVVVVLILSFTLSIVILQVVITYKRKENVARFG